MNKRQMKTMKANLIDKEGIFDLPDPLPVVISYWARGKLVRGRLRWLIDLGLRGFFDR